MKKQTEDKAFLDTSVLLYAYWKGDPRGEVAVELVAAGAIVGVQQLNEFASVAHRKLRKSWGEISAALGDLKIPVFLRNWRRARVFRKLRD